MFRTGNAVERPNSSTTTNDTKHSLGQAKTVLLRLCDGEGRLTSGDRDAGAIRKFHRFVTPSPPGCYKAGLMDLPGDKRGPTLREGDK